MRLTDIRTCPCLRPIQWLPMVGFCLLITGLLAGAVTVHVFAQDTDASNSGGTADAVNLHRIVVPTPLRKAQADQVLASIDALPAGATHVLLDFDGTRADVPAASRLASRIFESGGIVWTARVSGEVAGPALMPVTACQRIWIEPSGRLGPFEVTDPAWDRAFATFRSYLRSMNDPRRDRMGLWEKWTDPSRSLWVEGATSPAPVFHAEQPPQGVVAEKVQDAGPLVLVAADATQYGLARSIVEPLREFASHRGMRLVESTLRPDAVPHSEPVTDVSSVGKRPPLPGVPQTGAIIPITGPIDDGLAEHIRRRSAEAIKANATVIVFEMDTPGGLISSMGDIVEIIVGLRDQKVITVAWVKSDAISAGAMIAMSCDYIAMKTGTRIGDCQPIMMTGEGYTVAGEKMQTYLRTMITNHAQRNGYPQALAQAMITQEIEVIEIRAIHEADEDLLHDAFDSKYVTRRAYNGWEHKDRFEVVRVVVHGSRAADEVNAEGGTMGTTIDSGELLTLTDQDARKFGFAMPDVHSFDELMAAFRIGSEHGTGAMSRYEITWSVDFVRFLQSISGVLMLIGILGIYIEIKTPGVGLGGVIALIAFGLYFGSGIFIGLAESWEVIIFLIGILLIGAEIFVVPGFGITGILGMVLTFTGLLLAGQEFIVPETAQQSDAFVRNIGGLMLSLFGSFVGMYFLAKVLPGVPIFNRILLKGPSENEAALMHASGAKVETGSLVGAVGTAVSVLRPSGKAKFGNDILVVQTKGVYLEEGAEVVVTEARGNRIVVRAANPTGTAPAL